MSITLNGITKRFGGKTVLDDLTATLPGGVICLSGASGCGKTTLAMIIAGLLKPDSGNIGGISGNVTVMFQEPRLFPAFSALENVACAAKGSSGEAEAEKLLLSLGLTADDIKKKPCELSGGMNQRVSLARAVLFHENSGGNTVILDEPFKGLDRRQKYSGGACKIPPHPGKPPRHHPRRLRRRPPSRYPHKLFRPLAHASPSVTDSSPIVNSPF